MLSTSVCEGFAISAIHNLGWASLRHLNIIFLVVFADYLVVGESHLVWFADARCLRLTFLGMDIWFAFLCLFPC